MPFAARVIYDKTCLLMIKTALRGVSRAVFQFVEEVYSSEKFRLSEGVSDE